MKPRSFRALVVALFFTGAIPLSALADEPRLPPPPSTISPQAQAALLAFASAPQVSPPPNDQLRAQIDALQHMFAERQLKQYPVKIEDGSIAGVPVRIFTPANHAPVAGRVLMNLHGGGFVVDSGSLSENIPIAALTGMRVVAVRYRLAPEHPFPAALDDATAVYRALSKEVGPSHMAVYGTSAGAVLTLELLARLRTLHEPMPAAAGIFSGAGDLSVVGDSEQFLPALNGMKTPELLRPYTGSTPLTDPALSPTRGELGGLPPTLLMTSTRDVFLSHTVLAHAALRKAGVDADLVVFEAMPHAFWAYIDAPESDDAFDVMARFFKTRLR